MSQETKPTPQTIDDINKHLDALLGIDARKPGSAAKLPAVIRILETLEAAGGKDFPVFPPSYAGEGTKASPVYDLNGIEWGEALRVKGKDDNRRIIRYIKRARHCTMDSPQSHANRTEIAFVDDQELTGLVPQAEANIPRKPEFADQSNANLLTLPHRVGDFRVRTSDQKQAAASAIKALANGDALPLLRFMPTSLIFGFWDSRAEGYKHKHARILLTRIDAFDVVPCEKHALYIGPYSKDECAAVVLGDPILAEKLVDLDGAASDDDEKEAGKGDEKKWGDKMAERGFSNALSKPGSLGGIFADRIERLALISLTDIASIFCFKQQKETGAAKQESKKPQPDKDLTNAARRYLLAIALLAEAYPRSNGGYRLRSGCELLAKQKKIELLGSSSETEHSKALKSLCEDRAMLIEVAKAAHRILEIPAIPGAAVFKSIKESLRLELEQGKKGKGMGAGGRSKKAMRGVPAANNSTSSNEELNTDNQSD
jgi:CRISPR-associated protein Csb1